jgi:glycosyltransferase involved in cell wall biosynthesis
MAFEKISIVIPIHNESGNIHSLNAELELVLPALASTHEIIYVNDASTDSSLQELLQLKNVIIITLSRRYGQATALTAGFAHATGDVVVSLDGDGQNDPADIPLLISTLEEKNLDVVAGWRKTRKDKQGILVLTRIGRALRKALINDNVHDTGCTLRAYRSPAAKSLAIGGEMHRYVLALLRWKGFSIGEVVVNDRARVHGVSKYTYSKAVRGFIDLIYVWFIFKYSQRPLHLFGYMSLVTFVLSLISGGFTLYDKIFRNLHVNRDGWFFLTFFFFITAIMLFSFGIIIDLLMRIYLNTSPTEKPFYIRSIQSI